MSAVFTGMALRQSSLVLCHKIGFVSVAPIFTSFPPFLISLCIFLSLIRLFPPNYSLSIRFSELLRILGGGIGT